MLSTGSALEPPRHSSPSLSKLIFHPGVSWYEKGCKAMPNLSERIPCEAHSLVRVSYTPHSNLGVSAQTLLPNGIQLCIRASPRALADCSPPSQAPAWSVSDSPTFIKHSCSKPALNISATSLPGSLLLSFLHSSWRRWTCTDLLQMLKHLNIQHNPLSYTRASKKKKKGGWENKETTNK